MLCVKFYGDRSMFIETTADIFGQRCTTTTTTTTTTVYPECCEAVVVSPSCLHSCHMQTNPRVSSPRTTSTNTPLAHNQ